jgi:hypothetical protein
MKTTFKTFSTLVLATTMAFTSCKKPETPTPEEVAPTTPPTTTSANLTPGTTFAGADGSFIGLRNRVITNYVIAGTPIMTDIFSEVAVASVNTSSTSTTLVDAGAITANDSLLIKQSSNSYMLNKNNPNSTSNFTNFYNTGVKWSVTGNSGNNVPAFTYTASAFPATPALNVVTYNISKASSFYVGLTYATVSCDSLIFQIIGGDGTKLTSTSQAGSSTSHTFSSAEMATLHTSSTTSGIPTGQLSVFAYKYYNTTVGGKKYYFVNISAKTYLVNIQ